MDILKYIFRYPKLTWILDIHYIVQFLDIQKSDDYWISIIWFMDIQKWIMDILNTPPFLDIHKSIFGYPEIS